MFAPQHFQRRILLLFRQYRMTMVPLTRASAPRLVKAAAPFARRR